MRRERECPHCCGPVRPDAEVCDLCEEQELRNMWFVIAYTVFVMALAVAAVWQVISGGGK